MSEVYGAGSGISQGLVDLHNMASTGLVASQAQQAQMALEQQRQAMEVTRNYLARQGQAQQPAQQTQQPYGVVSPQAFGPQADGPQLGAPGGQAAPIDQVTQSPQPQVGQQPGVPSGPPPITDFMDGLSQEYMKAGLVTQASDLATHSADLKHKASLASSEAAQAKVRQLEGTEKELGIVGSVVGSYLHSYGDNPASFENAKHELITRFPQLAQVQGFVSEPYKPGVMAQVRDQALSAKDQVSSTREKLLAESTIALHDAEIDSAKTRAELNRQETIAKKTEVDFMLKNDGQSLKQHAAAMTKLGPGIRSVAQYYQSNPETLQGIDTKEKQVIEASHASIQNTEDIAQFIDTHPKAAGALAAALQKIGKPTFNLLDNMKKAGKSDAEIADAFFSKADLTGDAAILAKKLTVQALNDVQATAGGRMNMYLEKTFAQDIYNQSLSPKTLKRVLGDRQETAARTLKQFGIDVEKAPEGELKFYRGERKALSGEGGQKTSSQATEQHHELPDAKQYEGASAVDESTGQKYKAVNGTWVKQ